MNTLCRLIGTAALTAMVGSGMIGCQANGKRLPTEEAPTRVGAYGYYWRKEQPKAVPAAAPAPAPKAPTKK